MGKLVIGIGTGRCGTVSLAHLLNAQPGARVTHEAEPLMPWRRENATQNEREVLKRMYGIFDPMDAYRIKRDRFKERMGAYTLVGDIASFWLPYLAEIHRDFPGVVVVGLMRDKAGYVESAIRKTGGDDGPNFWDADGGWSMVFPQYPGMGKREAAARYWEDYNEAAVGAVDYCLFTDQLSDEAEQDQLFDFLGIDDHVHVLEAFNVGPRDYEAANGVREDKHGKPFKLVNIGGEVVRC